MSSNSFDLISDLCVFYIKFLLCNCSLASNMNYEQNILILIFILILTLILILILDLVLNLYREVKRSVQIIPGAFCLLCSLIQKFSLNNNFSVIQHRISKNDFFKFYFI